MEIVIILLQNPYKSWAQFTDPFKVNIKPHQLKYKTCFLLVRVLRISSILAKAFVDNLSS
jgi:hypothetical protein